MKSFDNCIHYCWYGKSRKSDDVLHCIDSWKKYCPNWKIVEWNEENSDFAECKFAVSAYEAKKWAFVSDYMRAKVLYENGGLFLDTDVELIKNIDELTFGSFLGFERDNKINPGLILFAKEPQEWLYECITDKYRQLTFDIDNMFNVTSPIIYTNVLCEHGLILNGEKQNLRNLTIYPAEYFNPIGNLYGGKPNITKNTYSIHHFDGSWFNEHDHELFNFRKKYGVRLGTMLYCLKHPIKSIGRVLK